MPGRGPGDPADILLIEDDPGDALMVRESFAAANSGSRFHVIPDGHRALRFLRRAGEYAGAPRPALILLDLHLPDLAGLDILTQIKTDPALAIIPVIVLSSSSDPADITAACARHANAYITKPADLDSYDDLVKQIEGCFLGLITPPPPGPGPPGPRDGTAGPQPGGLGRDPAVPSHGGVQLPRSRRRHAQHNGGARGARPAASPPCCPNPGRTVKPAAPARLGGQRGHHRQHPVQAHPRSPPPQPPGIDDHELPARAPHPAALQQQGPDAGRIEEIQPGGVHRHPAGVLTDQRAGQLLTGRERQLSPQPRHHPALAPLHRHIQRCSRLRPRHHHLPVPQRTQAIIAPRPAPGHARRNPARPPGRASPARRAHPARTTRTPAGQARSRVCGCCAPGLRPGSAHLHLSESSAENHVNAIFTKLGLTTEDLSHRRVTAVLTFLRDAGLRGG